VKVCMSCHTRAYSRSPICRVFTGEGDITGCDSAGLDTGSKRHDDLFAVDQILVDGIQLSAAGGVDDHRYRQIVTIPAGTAVYGAFTEIGCMSADDFHHDDVQIAIRPPHCLDGKFTWKCQGTFFGFAHHLAV